MRFVFFTKTEWAEVPRLRHQLARLLINDGHLVDFVEKPSYLLPPKVRRSNSEPGLRLFRYSQLLHHKLRVFWLPRALNALWEKDQIGRMNLGLRQSDVIVNFNYDYYFLRELFPDSKIITIINDNFWCRALFRYEAPLLEVLGDTVRSSDKVLTVSEPLRKEISKFCPVEIFYPWAERRYIEPVYTLRVKTDLLFWGYINERLDFVFLEQLAKKIKYKGLAIRFIFIGPTNFSKGRLPQLDSTIFKFEGPLSLDEIDLSPFFGAIIPYQSGPIDIEAITFPNKLLRLLSQGLPIFIRGMAGFINEPFIFRIPDDLDKATVLLCRVRDECSELQPMIKTFVEANSADSRLTKFLKLIEEIDR